VNTEPENPYAPPQAAIQIKESVIDLTTFDDASKSKRFANYVVDRIVIFGLAYAGGYVIGMLKVASIDMPYDLLLAMGTAGNYVVGYFMFLFYYVVMEGAFGLTLGKLVTGTRVVNGMGAKPSWGTILGRSFARIVPFEPFSFFGNTGWHDSWTETRVVDVRNRLAPLSPGLRNAYGRSY
jgi:uncharacterized RDD family membrane protein YckC